MAAHCAASWIKDSLDFLSQKRHLDDDVYQNVRTQVFQTITAAYPETTFVQGECPIDVSYHIKALIFKALNNVNLKKGTLPSASSSPHPGVENTVSRSRLQSNVHDPKEPRGATASKRPKVSGEPSAMDAQAETAIPAGPVSNPSTAAPLDVLNDGAVRWLRACSASLPRPQPHSMEVAHGPHSSLNTAPAPATGSSLQLPLARTELSTESFVPHCENIGPQLAEYVNNFRTLLAAESVACTQLALKRIQSTDLQLLEKEGLAISNMRAAGLTGDRDVRFQRAGTLPFRAGLVAGQLVAIGVEGESPQVAAAGRWALGCVSSYTSNGITVTMLDGHPSPVLSSVSSEKGPRACIHALFCPKRYRSMLGALDVPVNCWSDTAVDAYLCHTISVPQQLQSVLEVQDGLFVHRLGILAPSEQEVDSLLPPWVGGIAGGMIAACESPHATWDWFRKEGAEAQQSRHLVDHIYQLATQLNAEQQEVFRQVMEGGNRLTLIDGAAGSGKTALLALVVAAWVALFNGNVLVVAHSSSAVGILMRRLRSLGLNPVRLDAPTDPAEAQEGDDLLTAMNRQEKAADLRRGEQHLKALEHSLTNRALNPAASLALAKQIKILKADIQQLTAELVTQTLARARVACGAAATAGSGLLADTPFAFVAIDEGSALLEPEVLAAICKGSVQVICAGDLTETPLVRSTEALAGGLHMSLLGRLEIAGARVHRLPQQHRMHEVVAYYPSALWHRGGLRAAETGAGRWPWTSPSQPMVELPLPSPIGMVHVDGFEECAGFSRFNYLEARVVVALVRFLCEHGALPSALGVLTPYNGQAKCIKCLLQKVHPSAVDLQAVFVGSTDQLRGDERDIIILSLVRTRPVGEQERPFVCDESWMKVGLTRARRCLFVVGHVHAALYDPLWGPWLEQYAAYVYEFLPATRAITTLRDREMLEPTLLRPRQQAFWRDPVFREREFPLTTVSQEVSKIWLAGTDFDLRPFQPSGGGTAVPYTPTHEATAVYEEVVQQLSTLDDWPLVDRWEAILRETLLGGPEKEDSSRAKWARFNALVYQRRGNPRTPLPSNALVQLFERHKDPDDISPVLRMVATCLADAAPPPIQETPPPVPTPATAPTVARPPPRAIPQQWPRRFPGQGR